MPINLTAALTCPVCGHVAMEHMPIMTNAHVYECKGCKVALQPKDGDCCVFCSYSDERCPPQQMKVQPRYPSFAN